MNFSAGIDKLDLIQENAMKFMVSFINQNLNYQWNFKITEFFSWIILAECHCIFKINMQRKKKISACINGAFICDHTCETG